MKMGPFAVKRLTTQIAVAVMGASMAFGVIAAGTIKPSEEDITKYLRPAAVPQPADNMMTPERIELGKFLFFDPRLSGSNFISCATCHNPSMGWSDGQPTAIGHGMGQLARSSPTILNTAYQSLMMWDGRFRSLEEQALGPIEDGGEMAQPMIELIPEIKSISKYAVMFEAAYPGEGVTKEGIGKAIASFERSIVSTDSGFDRWLKGVDTAMSDSAKRGFTLFKGKANCAACHSGFNFSDNGFHNIGLPDSKDDGRYRVKKVAVLKGAFKTPTLRDVALTAPYMHNGQYSTLADVVAHYNRGGDKNPGHLSPNMKPLNLSKAEQQDLVEFLKALTGDPLALTFPQLPVN